MADQPDTLEAPEVITLEEVDVIRVLYMQERGRRIDAEQATYRLENQTLVANLGKKYGIDLSNYELDLTERKAKRRK